MKSKLFTNLKKTFSNKRFLVFALIMCAFALPTFAAGGGDSNPAAGAEGFGLSAQAR